jgi:hypothetical protein
MRLPSFLLFTPLLLLGGCASLDAGHAEHHPKAVQSSANCPMMGGDKMTGQGAMMGGGKMSGQGPMMGADGKMTCPMQAPGTTSGMPPKVSP